MSTTRAEFSLVRLGTGIFLIVSGIHLFLSSLIMRGIPALPLILMAIALQAVSIFCLPKSWRFVPLAGILICVTGVLVVIDHHQRTLEDLARQEAYARRVYPKELPGLAIGNVCPDIQTKTISGGEMTLSAYRGKVVLLVFWASWCGPCMADIPHERELSEQFAGRPFTILGVNGDHSVEKAQAAVSKHEIPWESFWNGEEGGKGLLTERFGVQAWPTIYVIDDLGVIRYKHLRGRRLDEPLEELVDEAERRAL